MYLANPILILGILSTIGCTTIEKTCETEVAKGYFNDMQTCITTRYEQQQRASASLQNLGNSLNQGATGSSGQVDQRCLQKCIQAGYAMGLCNSRCGY